MGRTKMAAFAMVLALAIALAAVGAEAASSYKEGETVKMYANKVGPFNNPSETYQYYTLPFCQASKKKYKLEGLGEVLGGDRLVNTPFDLGFKVDKPDEKICTKQLTRKDQVNLKNAIENDFYFQMIFDQLPLWGLVGKVRPCSRRHPSKLRSFEPDLGFRPHESLLDSPSLCPLRRGEALAARRRRTHDPV